MRMIDSPLGLAGIALATALPPLIAYNLTPAATLFNQLLALGGWGAVLAWLAKDSTGRAQGSAASWALVLMLVAALSSPGLNGLPWSMALSSGALLGGGLLVLVWAQSLDAGWRRGVMQALCWGLLLGGVLSVAVSLVQVFVPGWADGVWIARSGIPGRAVGNMRQPNHLASWLMWAAVAAVFLAEDLRTRWPAAWRVPVLGALLAALVFAVVLSASRTGMVGVLLLAAWGGMDRGLSRPVRWVLLSTPLMLGLSWWGLSLWASEGHAFGAGSRLAAEGAGSPSRMAILANAWSLLRMNPWTGVGWGEFNLAWTLTPFPDRPVAFFDHCHNLLLQLLVELGWPLGALVLGLLASSLWRIAQAAWLARGAGQAEAALLLRSGLMLVLTIGLHSLLEYPLWYAYFLLPALCALGLCLGGVVELRGLAKPLDGPAGGQRGSTTVAAQAGVVLALGGAVLVLAAIHARWDYERVVAIYAPPKGAAPLQERIEEGRRSPWFKLQADYAAATTLMPGEAALAAARQTGHHLIDTRLMMAWARSLDAVGQTDQARYLVERLREFRNAASADWLAQCEAVPPGGVPPFQCEAPQQTYGFRDFRR